MKFRLYQAREPLQRGLQEKIDRLCETAGLLSTVASRVVVRVIRTGEDLMIACSVCRILKTDAVKKGLIHEDPHAHSGTTPQTA